MNYMAEGSKTTGIILGILSIVCGVLANTLIVIFPIIGIILGLVALFKPGAFGKILGILGLLYCLWQTYLLLILVALFA
jgi:hypothetical protein